MKPVFLTLDEVLAIHHDQLIRYGGAPGIRDLTLLESAIGTPAVTFGGTYLHQSFSEMAAAYLFHITQNHPFTDGNKRSGLATALVFLLMNDRELDADGDELYELVIAVAIGKKTKAEIAVFIEQNLTSI